MGQPRRSGSDSRACQPQTPPLTWRDHVDIGHPSVVALDDWLNSLAPFAAEHERGEIDDLFDAARRGALEDSGDEHTPIKPIYEDPEVYELRRKALSKQLRFYHGEPDRYPRLLIALHRHIKTGADAQQVEILYAVGRYQPPPTRE